MADINISDHQLIYFIKKKQRDIPTKTTFEGRSYRNYDCELLSERLDEHDWNRFYIEAVPNILWDIMLNNIETTLNEICPLRTFRIKKYKEPWITQELLELIKDKDSLLKKAKRTKCPEDLTIAKRYRNDCLSKIRKAKADFVSSELETNNMSDSKKFWKNIKNVLPIGVKANKKIRLSNTNTNVEIPECDTACHINDFFCQYWANFS